MHLSDLEQVKTLCRDAASESLNLEFKEKAIADKPDLDNADKKVIAKAASSFANSGGGTLVFGIRTTRVGEMDVADEIRLIKEAEKCRAQVEFVCKANVSPEIHGVEVRALVDDEGDGVIICDFPSSERRPHMSTAPGVHAYFRRTFQGDVPMTPFEVQEQILAVREAALTPRVDIGTAASFSNLGYWIAIKYTVEFGIENIGSRACLNPFLRVRSSEPTESHGAYFEPRRSVWKKNVAPGTIVHVDDTLDFFGLEFIARVQISELRDAREAGTTELVNCVRIYGDKDDLHSKTITDKTEVYALSFEVEYGAENSVSRKQSFAIDRDEIASRILIKHGNAIRDMTISEIGIWRADLVEELKSLYPGGYGDIVVVPPPTFEARN